MSSNLKNDQSELTEGIKYSYLFIENPKNESSNFIEKFNLNILFLDSSMRHF